MMSFQHTKISRYLHELTTKHGDCKERVWEIRHPFRQKDRPIHNAKYKNKNKCFPMTSISMQGVIFQRTENGTTWRINLQWRREMAGIVGSESYSFYSCTLESTVQANITHRTHLGTNKWRGLQSSHGKHFEKWWAAAINLFYVSSSLLPRFHL